MRALAEAVARAVFGADALWHGIAALDNRLPDAAQMAMLRDIATNLALATRWFLRDGGEVAPATLIARFKPAIAARSEILPPPSWVDAVDAALSRGIAVLAGLATVLDVVLVAEQTGVDVCRAGQEYFAIGEELHLVLLLRQALLLPMTTIWQRLAADTLVAECFAQQRALARRRILGQDLANQGQLEDVLRALSMCATPDFALLTVASHRLARFLAG